MHDVEAALATLVVAVVLGIFAQVVAHRFKLPAILPLLLFGIAAGPYGLRVFDPAALGPLLEVFIHLGVAVILFEGSLSLDLGQLRKVGGPVRNLLSIGAAVTGVASAWLVTVLTDAPFATAAIFGAIVTVTGPTVVVPLLRHMVVTRKVRTILLSEGLMIDPIGAVLAYFVLLWIERTGLDARELSVEVMTLCASGAIFGFAAGAIAKVLARSRQVAAELRNLVILALVLGSYYVAESQAPQSGIVAAVVMGMTMSATKIPDVMQLRAFKEQLTVFLISVLFILLSGHLGLDTILHLGAGGVWVVMGVILFVRPLAVLLSVPPKQLDWRERVVLSMTAPRGIVAAAVASLSAIQLREHDMVAAAEPLEGLVYLTIILSCSWATVMAIVLPRVLGYTADPSRRLVVLVGANPVTATLAELFRRHDWTAVVVDQVAAKLAPLRERGFGTVRGDARAAGTYEEAFLERDSFVVAATANDELNLLVAEMVREEFGVEHPAVVMQRPSEELGQVRRAWIDVLGNGELSLTRWGRKIEAGRAEVRTLATDDETPAGVALRALLREPDPGYVVLCGWQADRPSFRVELAELDRFQEVSLLVDRELAAERLPPLPAAGETPAEAAELERQAAPATPLSGVADPA